MTLSFFLVLFFCRSIFFLFLFIHCFCMFVCFLFVFFPLNFPQYVTWMKDQSIRQKEKLAQSSFGSTWIPSCFSSHTWHTPDPPPTNTPTYPPSPSHWLFHFLSFDFSWYTRVTCESNFFASSHFFSSKSNYWWSLFYLIIKRV